MDNALISFFLLSAFFFLILIFALVKRGKIDIKFSLPWFAFMFLLLLFAAFPFLALSLSHFLHFTLTVNLIFTLVFSFILFVLLFFTAEICTLYKKNKQLVQYTALLEKRVRKLEEDSKKSPSVSQNK